MMDLTDTIRRAMTLCDHLEMRAVGWTPELVELDMDWDERMLTSGGALHGGALMALADAAGGACAAANLPEGAVGTSTIESKTNFLGAVREGTVRASSRPLHVGSTTIVVETELRRVADGRLVAKTTQTQTVLRPR
jgi:1,4-dihydroxy-2-naphthoyl-CoA hydrolase